MSRGPEINTGKLDRDHIRAGRPTKLPRDPLQPLGHRWEVEPGVRVRERRALTVFLAGAECPFSCLFCDLWQFTLESETPEGALPHQLRVALDDAAPLGSDAAIKLYNASNFFDRRAVPATDLPQIIDQCLPFARVTVESHPKLLGDACEEFAARLSGRLEIAMGLETIHPTVFPRLKDGMTIADFDTAAAWARTRDIGVRAFLLVGLPWVSEDAFAAWAARSAVHAIDAGADRVSLIPLRADGSALVALSRSGELSPVRLIHLEDAFERALDSVAGRGLVEADLWDVATFASCSECRDDRTKRLATMNLEQRVVARIECACSGA